MNIQEMTIEEKIRTMELLWDDICRRVPDFDSPPWHGDLLKKRENLIEQGKEKFIDWDEAKKNILNSIS